MRESLLLQKYKSYLESTNVSTATVDNYVADVVFFLGWLITYLPSHGYSISTAQPSAYISYVDNAIVGEFSAHLSRGTFSNSTVARKVAGLKSFFKFVVTEGYLTTDPFLNFNIDPLNHSRSTLSSFRTWLQRKKVTDHTIKNYISDIRHLLHNEVKLIPESIRAYLILLDKQYSKASYKRKLASIRKFIDFMESVTKLDQQAATTLKKELLINTNVADVALKVDVVPKNEPDLTIDEPKSSITASLRPLFSSHLSLVLLFLILSSNIFLLGRMNTSLSSAINATTDILDKGSAGSVEDSLTVTIPFTGKLKDMFGIPLSYENEFSFSLYPTSDAIDPIYSTGRCSTTPGSSGNFTVILGQDCGHPIPYSLLQQYPEVYLGASVGFGPELKPRIALKRFEFGYVAPTPTPTPVMRIAPLFLDDELSTLSAELATTSASLSN